MSMQTSLLREEYVPLASIRRPIPPVLDNQKIDSMVLTLKGIPMESSTCKVEDIVAGELPAIDVFKVKEKGKLYYFAFGGCHRFQAYDETARHQQETLVKCKILPATKDSLKVYLGGSVEGMFE